MREFLASAAALDGGMVQFTLDGAQYQARRPSGGQETVLVVLMMSGRPEVDHLYALMALGEAVVIPPGWDRLLERLADDDDPFDFEHLSKIMAWLVEEWAGCAYWAISRLLGAAAENWNRFHGWAIARRIDPFDLRYDQYLALIHHWLTEGADVEQLEEFEQELNAPPADASDEDYARQPEWSEQEVGAGFMAALGGVGAVPAPSGQ